jgi:hypothetical protein
MRFGSAGAVSDAAGSAAGGEEFLLVRVELRKRQHGGIAPDFEIGLARLGLGRQQEIGGDLGRRPGPGIDGDGEEMGVADGAIGMLPSDCRRRQLARCHEIGGLVGIGGEAISSRRRQHLLHLRLALRELFAAAPQSGCSVEIAQAGFAASMNPCGHRRARTPIGDGFGQHSLDESGAVKIRRGRIGNAARFGGSAALPC